jgi:hypothetical protein
LYDMKCCTTVRCPLVLSWLIPSWNEKKTKGESLTSSTEPIFVRTIERKKFGKSTSKEHHYYCISHPFKRRNRSFGRFTEFLFSRMFFCFRHSNLHTNGVWRYVTRGCSHTG